MSCTNSGISYLTGILSSFLTGVLAAGELTEEANLTTLGAVFVNDGAVVGVLENALLYYNTAEGGLSYIPFPNPIFYWKKRLFILLSFFCFLICNS